MDDLSVARKAAQAGAEVVRRWYCRIERAEFKGISNPVTKADRESEAAIVEILAPTTALLPRRAPSEGPLPAVAGSSIHWTER